MIVPADPRYTFSAEERRRCGYGSSLQVYPRLPNEAARSKEFDHRNKEFFRCINAMRDPARQFDTDLSGIFSQDPTLLFAGLGALALAYMFWTHR